MKKSLIALAALAAVSAASAQSNLAIYGNIDQSLYAGHDHGVTQSGLASNAASTSTLGFKGMEDLGNGLSANFNLLGELSLKEGQMGSTTSGNAATSGGQKPDIFTRGATIGLADKTWGSFDAGRITDAVWVMQGTYNNTGMNSLGWNALTATSGNPGDAAMKNFTGKGSGDATFSGTTSSSTAAAVLGTANGAASGSSPFNFGSGFTYSTPVIAGFVATVQKFGTQSGYGVTEAGAGTAYNLNYSNPMGLRLSIGTSARNGSNRETAISFTVYGAEYKTGKYTFVAGLTKNKYEGTMSTQDNVTVTGLGVGYDLTPQTELKLAYTTLKDDNQAGYKTTIIAATGRYKLSSRTSVYAGLGFGQNDGANNKQSVFYGGANPTVGASNQTGFITGIKHAF